MPCLVHITAVIMIRYEAITQSLITLRFGDARNDIEVGKDYLAFQKAKPKADVKYQIRANHQGRS